jgi:hypothetical protein
MNLGSIHVFIMKKSDNSVNFTAGRIINHRTHHNSLCTDKNKHFITSYVMVYEAMRHVMPPHVQAIPCSYISCIKQTEVTSRIVLVYTLLNKYRPIKITSACYLLAFTVCFMTHSKGRMAINLTSATDMCILNPVTTTLATSTASRKD